MFIVHSLYTSCPLTHIFNIFQLSELKAGLKTVNGCFWLIWVYLVRHKSCTWILQGERSLFSILSKEWLHTGDTHRITESLNHSTVSGGRAL